VTVGAATLSWQPPTQYVDGTPLQDLAGFKIRYGTVADKLDQIVTVPNPGITSAMIESLAVGDVVLRGQRLHSRQRREQPVERRAETIL